jgi:hypothetical protein
MDKIKIASEKGYVVDDNGSVFYNGKQRKLHFKSKKQKYYCFTARIDGATTRIEVHRLQAFQKYGSKIFEDGIVVRHLNGDSTDNSIDNIEIGSYQDNSLDVPQKRRLEHAKYMAGFMQKYNHDEVYEFYQKTHSYKKTMEQFGITSKNGLHHIIAKFKKNK